MSLFHLPSPLQQLKSGFLSQKKVELWVKRDDLIHETISGNKWRKLKYNFETAEKEGHSTLLTFGGAFSNHLIATAAAAKQKKLKSIGIIRGEESKELSDTLLECEANGMQLHFVSREQYRKKTEKKFLEELKNDFGKFYLIPEGGANNWGSKGCGEIITEDLLNVNHIAVAAGTGTTASGILAVVPKNTNVLVFPVLKGVEYLKKEILDYSNNIHKEKNLQFISKYHFGGYAKITEELVVFTNEFFNTYQVKLDLVYTAKLFYGLFDLIDKGHFEEGSRILAIHTGGIQGNRGMQKRYGVQLFNS